MSNTHWAAILIVAPLAQAVRAEVGREGATIFYFDALAQPAFEPRTIPDREIAMEGLSADPLPEDLTPGYILIEGDIQVPIEEWEEYFAGSPRAVFGTVNYWGAVVPFDFAPNLFDDGQDPVRRQAAIDAMNAISARAGVIFQPRNAESDWIRFQQSPFNNSPVGRRGGMQIINIVSWGTQIVIVHELYHSLGFWHEQNAPDRGAFVTINYDNICGSSSVPNDPCNANVCAACMDAAGNFISCAFAFDITTGADVWGPYDFDSFMHYGRSAFSCNGGDTITVNEPWNGDWQDAIGQRNHFSLIDELSCRGIYPFAGDRWLRAGTGGANTGTFFDPFRGTFTSAYNGTPANGTLLVDPGTYSGVGTYSAAKTIRGTYGLVTIGN